MQNLPLQSTNAIDFNWLKSKIKESNLLDFLNNAGYEIHHNKMICPFCGSGTGKHKTSAFHVFQDNHFKCFSCLVRGDIIDFVMKAQGMDYTAAILYIAQELQIPIPENSIDHPPLIIKIPIGSKFVFDEEKNAIVEVPVSRQFYSRDDADAFIQKRSAEYEKKVNAAFYSTITEFMNMNDILDLIIGQMGTTFEKKYYSAMGDKTFAFNKIVEWKNKRFEPKKYK